MRINFKSIFLGVGLLSLSSTANAELNIFACEPEYGALAKELAPQAQVYSATTALQDPHHIQARPSLIAKMRRADLVICAGADLEIGWLPMLQLKAANSAVRNAQTGLFFASEHIDTLDKLENVDRSMGDVHEKGNPHVHFDPYRVLTLAKSLTQRLSKLDPEHAAEYQANSQSFEEKWTQAITQWEQKAQPLRGKEVIAYHSSFRYLFHWLGMKQVADLEPKPGLAPTAGHLTQLIDVAKTHPVSGIVLTSYQDKRGGTWLADRTNLPLLVMPMTVGGDAHSQDLFGLYDSVIHTLLTKLKSTSS